MHNKCSQDTWRHTYPRTYSIREAAACRRSNGKEKRTKPTKRSDSLISLPFYESATWPIKGEMSEQDQKRVLLFIALEG